MGNIRIKGLTRKLFRSLLTLNLAVTLGILLFAIFAQNVGAVIYASIWFSIALGAFVIGEWYDEWLLSSTKRISYILATLVLALKLFSSSEAFMVFIVIDVILVEVLFNRYVASERVSQNRGPMYIIAVGLLIAFLDETFNFVQPNILNTSQTMEVLIFLFVLIKLVFASSMLFAESRRSATQRLKEEQFVDYSADFNNFFSHYINTPLTTAMSNIEIARFKLSKKTSPEVLELLEKNFNVVNEGLENISKTTRELANIHYIRSEVLRNGNEIWNIETDLSKLSSDYGADLEQVIDHWHKVHVPKAMLMFSLDHIFSNAQKYAEGDSRMRVVVHEEPGLLVVSTFNKGNIPNFSVDVLQPFQRGENVLEGTGTGLGLSLIPDLVQDFGCKFTLSNIGGFTRAQIKIPLESSATILSFAKSGLTSQAPNTEADDSAIQGYQAHT